MNTSRNNSSRTLSNLPNSLNKKRPNLSSITKKFSFCQSQKPSKKRNQAPSYLVDQATDNSSTASSQAKPWRNINMSNLGDLNHGFAGSFCEKNCPPVLLFGQQAVSRIPMKKATKVGCRTRTFGHIPWFIFKEKNTFEKATFEKGTVPHAHRNYSSVLPFGRCIGAKYSRYLYWVTNISPNFIWGLTKIPTMMQHVTCIRGLTSFLLGWKIWQQNIGFLRGWLSKGVKGVSRIFPNKFRNGSLMLPLRTPTFPSNNFLPLNTYRT